ncbi:hypothetical protein E2C01_097171 [Portunus trituberculatus]|uniref:Uncharacterized protein n=1 Tax=Portunus trituberculatus TaxID=210409 RepID=A0A5B7KAI8_PORTR|nr:hypothetical protein [Portunus trituberculatus]
MSPFVRHMFTFFFQSLSSPQLFSVKASRPAGQIRVPLLLCGSPVNFQTTTRVPGSRGDLGRCWGGVGEVAGINTPHMPPPTFPLLTDHPHALHTDGLPTQHCYKTSSGAEIIAATTLEVTGHPKKVCKERINKAHLRNVSPRPGTRHAAHAPPQQSIRDDLNDVNTMPTY